MSCAACHHTFSLREALQQFNPWNFRCPSCGVRLELGPGAWAFLALAVALGVLAGSQIARLYLAGTLSLAGSLLALVALILAGIPLEYALVRHARFRVR